MAPARYVEYPHPMNNKKLFFKTNKVGFVLGAVLLTALIENAGYAGGVSVVIGVPPPVVVAPPVVVVQDDYVYYPDYAIYYNSSRHQYAYLEGDAWVLAPAPQGVTVEVLLASPSVHMDFHDSPEKHHAEMLKQYPKNWAPRDDNHREDHDKK